METAEILKAYMKYRGIEEGSQMLQSRYFPSVDENLTRQDRSLAIMLKQRQLGLPVNSDYYNKNYGKDRDTFYNHAVRQTGKAGLKALEPKRVPFKTAPDPLFDVAKNIGSELFSLGKSIKVPKLGGRYATIFSAARGTI